MYVNKDDDKIKQLHADIGRTIPKEDLKLGQKMKDGDVVKKKTFKQIQKDADEIDRTIREAPAKSTQPEVPSKEKLPKMAKLKKKKKKKTNPKTDFEEFKKLLKKHRSKEWTEHEDAVIWQWMNKLFPSKPKLKPKPTYSEEQNIAQGGKVKKKKYSYRRGGLTTLRKPKRG